MAGFLLGKRKRRKGGEKIVKRILTVLTVALVIAALMVVMAVPAFAAKKPPRGPEGGQAEAHCASQGRSPDPNPPVACLGG